MTISAIVVFFSRSLFATNASYMALASCGWYIYGNDEQCTQSHEYALKLTVASYVLNEPLVCFGTRINPFHTFTPRAVNSITDT